MKGYRTYLIGAGLALLAAAHYIFPTIVNDQLYLTLQGVLTGAGLAALRAAV